MKNIKYKLFSVGSILVLGIIFSLLITSFLGGGKSKVFAAATGFQPGHIIDDNIFTNDNSLTEPQIQTFLNDMVGSCYAPNAKSTNPGNGSCINQYVENTSNLTNNFSNPNATIPGGISAAQIIYDAAHEYDINPEVLLVTMQKEQGLVTDNWPYYSEYQYAMGYSCPDTNAGCSGTYADFYKQVDGAAWQFRHYLNSPGAYNYWIGSNTIDYAPGCGGSTVNIQNAATAALYIYTPYQPDSNVLNATNSIGSSSGPGPAISDSCAAYGNRNFWWYFNSWFGSSVDTNVSLIEESGTSTYYVYYDGQKQGIPSYDVLSAWGLNGLTPTTLDPAVFNSIPTVSTALTRYVQNTQTGATYFADNGNVYSVSANDATDWNNFPGQTESQVSSTLINFANYQGEIKPFVSVSGNSTFYAMDDGTLHPITSGAVYNLWAGENNPPITLSSAYFNTLTVSSSDIDSPEFTYGGTTYVLNGDEIFSLTSNTLPLVPSSWGGLTIGFGLADSFTNGGPLSYMIQAAGLPAVYMLDTNGVLRGIPDPQTDNAFQKDSSGDTTLISSDLLNAFTVGTPITSNIVTLGIQPYVVNKGLQPISSGLAASYNASSTGITLSSAYQNIFPTLSAATPFVQSNSSPAIYFLDSGSLLPFSNPTTANLVAGSSSVTYLLDNSLSKFGHGQIMQNYITNGTTDYLLDNGSAYTVPSAGVAAAWNIYQPLLTISTAAAANFASAGTLSQYVQIPDGQMCLIDRLAYCAGSSAMVTMWNLQSATMRPSQVLLNSQGLTNVTLSPFAGSSSGTYSGTLFTAAGGKLYGIPSYNAALNLGVGNWPIDNLDTFTISNLLKNQTWQGYLATDSSGNDWVIDGGVKHAISSTYQSAWVGSNTPTTLGTDYLSLLPTGQPISNSINGSGPTIYGILNGQRYAFPSWQAYHSAGLANSMTVSDSLLQSIPYGGIWPN
jgi:hypothetical protein